MEDDYAGLVEMEPSGLFSDKLLLSTVDEFTSNGAWLILSIVSYGWRSYYDLANAVVCAAPPSADPPWPRPIDDHFQIVRDPRGAQYPTDICPLGGDTQRRYFWDNLWVDTESANYAGRIHHFHPNSIRGRMAS